MVQLGPVAHLPPVDINEGRTLAEHLETVLLPLQAGDACQDVFRRTCLAEDGALHGGGQRVVLHAGNGQRTLHHHLAQQRGIRLQTQRTHFARCTPIIYTHITHAGNTQQAFLARGVLQLERTVLAAHHARHVGRVRQGQEHDVGVGHRLVLFVHQPPADGLCRQSRAHRQGRQQRSKSEYFHR